MKRWMAWLLTAVLSLSLCSCGEEDFHREKLKKLGMNPEGTRVSLRMASKFGPHGGKLLKLVVECPENLGNQIRKDPRWRPCPMEEDAENLVCRELKGLSRSVAELKSGYYLLLNDSGESLSCDPEEPCYDFLAAVYDLDRNILYYCEADS